MASRSVVRFDGFDQVVRQYQHLGDRLKPIVEDVLKAEAREVNPELQAAMAPHRQTGKTERSMETANPITWTGTEATMPVGFHIRRGGLPSIFLMYGTPRHAPNHPGTQADRRLYDAIYGQNAELQRLEEQILRQGIERAMRGG